MSAVTAYVAAAALLGSAVIGGVFFAFSSFVMKALARVPASAGIGAMQSINVVVLNASFLGTAVLSRYLRRWTMLNTVRAIAAIAAALMHALGLLANSIG